MPSLRRTRIAARAEEEKRRKKAAKKAAARVSAHVLQFPGECGACLGKSRLPCRAGPRAWAWAEAVS